VEKYFQDADLILFGIEVKSFPDGIKETFDTLFNVLGNGRSFYGVSWFDESGRIIYYAMALEIFADENKIYKYETLILQKGEYLTITVFDWLSKTSSIKDVFHELMKDSRPDKNYPCIEWYKSDNEMVCMVNAKGQ
jgi:hypothetical protein